MNQQGDLNRITDVGLPESVNADASTRRNPAIDLSFTTERESPFPQIIVRGEGRELVFKEDAITTETMPDGTANYRANLEAGKVGPGRYEVQFEVCNRSDWWNSGGGEWIKHFAFFEIRPAPREKITVTDTSGVRIYFGIHKHMHQPYYDATNPEAWDGEKASIFSTRHGAYSQFIPTAISHYENGALGHAGLSSSWSGSLIEQLNAKGGFPGWNNALRASSRQKTELDHSRCGFSAFGFFHPLMPLIPARNIIRHIELHRDIIRNTFETEPLGLLFPPETAFHVRMIPALLDAGIEAVIYDSVHRFRACPDYPYAGKEEGMLPPNRSEQVNAPAGDWLRLQNVWAPAPISPSCLKPEWISYTDPEGKEHRIIGIPAERYLGNEDARGGFGALQYPSVFSQIFEHIRDSGTFDPKHPPFFLLHSDGDNYGGGTDSYYGHNTERLVEWLREDPRFELTTVDDYLDRFPPDPEHTVHVEPGSWAGADNGDPQFRKWFSRYEEPYSPDLNSWAVLTAFQNCVHTAIDNDPDSPTIRHAERLMLTAETSCYWYWTGQDVWDQQVTSAANLGLGKIQPLLEAIASTDCTPPTIFAPWITPENPGGKTWGNNCLLDAPATGTVHTFVYDVAGLAKVRLVLKTEAGTQSIEPKTRAPYPSRTGPARIAEHFTFELAGGLGDCRYYIEATDQRGNTSRSALERIWL